MYLSDKDAGFIIKIRHMAIVLSVAPFLYLGIAYFLSTRQAYLPAGFLDIVPYMLLPVAAVIPYVLLMVEKLMIQSFRESSDKKNYPGGLFFSLFVIKLAGAQAAFIIGFIVFLLGGEISRMVWFYPIGMIWMYILWPRENSFRKLLEQLEAK